MQTPPARADNRPQATPDVSTTAAPSPQSQPGGPTISPTPFPLPDAAPSTPLPAGSEEAQEGSWWLWLGALALIAAIAGAVVWWRRREESRPPAEIEPPLARTDGNTPPVPVVGGEALALQADALKLTRSVSFVTLAYQLTLTNQAGATIDGLTVGADLVSAHANVPIDRQFATSETVLPVRHTVERISPAQSLKLQGQVQLPIAEVQIIRQGRAALMVPLLRLRVEGAGEEPLLRTLVIGQGLPHQAKLHPFRLDEGPRIYQPIAQRALD